jgi:AraC-like DNA-binding protein
LLCRALPGLQLMAAQTSPIRIARPRAFLDDGNDDLCLVINRCGAVAASARGRELSLGDGDAVLMSASDVSSFNRYSPGASLTLRIPRSVLTSMVADVDDAVMSLIPGRSEALHLLTSYAAMLTDENMLVTPELQRTVTTHLHDLVALALGATRDATEVSRNRGVRAARLRAIKTFTIENSSRRDLSIGVVAAHFGVTPRYLQKLFEDDGTTFSTFLLQQRLARAHRMLTQPRFAQSLVSTVAYDVGFGDLSYFNRCFKRYYGATPGDLREAVVK